jgi:hypothetical protein
MNKDFTAEDIERAISGAEKARVQGAHLLLTGREVSVALKCMRYTLSDVRAVGEEAVIEDNFLKCTDHQGRGVLIPLHNLKDFRVFGLSLYDVRQLMREKNEK